MHAKAEHPFIATLRGFVVLSGLIAAGLCATPSSAAAELQIAVDLDYALSVEDLGESGGGFAVRLGQQLHIPVLTITPEAVFDYHQLAGDGEPTIYRGLAGLRLGIGEIFRFGPMGHVGVGNLDIDGFGVDPSTAFTWDAGLFFQLTIIPLFNVGVHGLYNDLAGSDGTDAFNWLTFGAHLELII